MMEGLRLGNFWVRSPALGSRDGVPTKREALQISGLVFWEVRVQISGESGFRYGRVPGIPGLLGTFSGLVPRWVGWSPWVY